MSRFFELKTRIKVEIFYATDVGECSGSSDVAGRTSVVNGEDEWYDIDNDIKE